MASGFIRAIPICLSIRQGRFNSSKAGLRDRLLLGVVTAMKNNDTFSSTTLRSVLSEVYAADKLSVKKLVPTSVILEILRKATSRRNESAAVFTKALRPDLAKKEQREAELLSTFLPPCLPEDEIDRVLSDIIALQPRKCDPRKNLGEIYKAFYFKVDKTLVDPVLVKARANALLKEKARMDSQP